MIEKLAATKCLVVEAISPRFSKIPDLATPLARSKAALEALAAIEGTTVAVISGKTRSVGFHERLVTPRCRSS
jgi:trehalose-6-phosphatase